MLRLKADARIHMAFAREEIGSPLVEQGGLQLMGLSRVTLIGLRLSWRHPPACRGSPSTTAGTCSRFESNISVPPRPLSVLGALLAALLTSILFLVVSFAAFVVEGKLRQKLKGSLRFVLEFRID